MTSSERADCRFRRNPGIPRWIIALAPSASQSALAP
jgi:hypothetical protein